ncbi:MAG: glycosyltransferase family 4 protein [Desulfomonilaceae bacterium]|jgi:glycosyltransferase involved in cell wall biosynthesis
MRILHLSTHLGGGVGRFYKNILRYDLENEHVFALIESPKDRQLLPEAHQWFLVDAHEHFHSEIEKADIVQIEFWNHPKLYSFLVNMSAWPSCRLALYSHVSGIFPPAYLPPALAKSVDKLLLATFASKFSDAATELKDDLTVVPEFGGGDRTAHIKNKPHSDFVVLYIGSADALKIHPELISWCVELCQIDNMIKFIFCTQDDSKALSRRVPKDHIENFTFYERLEDLTTVIEFSDIFGYALHPRHFGTGEQALIEAMSAGLVPIVMDNPAERFIVSNGNTGILAKSDKEYKDAVLFLKRNPDVLNLFRQRARQAAKSLMSAENTTEIFHAVYLHMAKMYNKNKHSFPLADASPWQLFLMSQGDDAKVFERATQNVDRVQAKFTRWQLKYYDNHLSPKKGTLSQWYGIFPEDERLCLAMKTISEANMFEFNNELG